MPSPELELNADPVPASVQELITFFSTELREVSFPDVDATSLAELAEQVRTRAKDLARARQVLEEVQLGLDDARGDLEQNAQRALAYLRVFASGDEKLSSAVAGLTLGATPRRRSRSAETTKKPKKKKARPPALPLDTEAPGSELPGTKPAEIAELAEAPAKAPKGGARAA